MKSILLALSLSLPFCLAAQTIIVTAKVNDRSQDGSAIRGQFKYPSAELNSGDTASLHIGELLRYPVWQETVELEDGVSKDELIYEETPIGLVLGLRVAADEEGILYSGKIVSSVVNTVTATGTSLSATEVTFIGKVASGELITVTSIGPDGTPEEVALHFAVTE